MNLILFILPVSITCGNGAVDSYCLSGCVEQLVGVEVARLELVK